MKILGNRVLVSKIEKEQKEGFQAVEVQDDFIYKGRVEQLGIEIPSMTERTALGGIVVGSTVIFAKYSPDTQDVEHEGKKYKVVSVSDVLAVL